MKLIIFLTLFLFSTIGLANNSYTGTLNSKPDLEIKIDESNFEFDSDHEGHGGWRSDQISYNIESWVKLNTPDIVLLHIGTNDLVQGYPPSHVIEHIGKTIEIIRLYNPEVIILVAKIIPYDLEVNFNHSDLNFGGLEITFLIFGLLIIGEVIRRNYFNNN